MTINQNYNLTFIQYDDLFEICKSIIDAIQNKKSNIDKTLHTNIIDPFSAVFEASFHKVSLTQWLEMEKARQIQKSFQNQIGDFHQKVLGKVQGWENLKTGKVLDIVNHERKIVAEIKNKFNTTKGNHKPAIYDDIESEISKNYKEYKGYYVSIIDKKRFDVPFTPSDNKNKQRRQENANIRHTDGATFYEIATGQKDAIANLYKTIPYILSQIAGNNTSQITNDPLFLDLFQKSFK